MKWPVETIDVVAQVNPKLAAADRPDLDEIVCFVPMAAVSEETLSIEAQAERPFSEVAKGYTPFKRGDVLVAKITPCFENGKMAAEDERGRQSFAPNSPPTPRRAEADCGNSGCDGRLRAKRREALAQIDILLQSTFLDMFGDPVVNPMEWEERHLPDPSERASPDPYLFRDRPTQAPSTCAKTGASLRTVFMNEVSGCRHSAQGSATSPICLLPRSKFPRSHEPSPDVADASLGCSMRQWKSWDWMRHRALHASLSARPKRRKEAASPRSISSFNQQPSSTPVRRPDGRESRWIRAEEIGRHASMGLTLCVQTKACTNFFSEAHSVEP